MLVRRGARSPEQAPSHFSSDPRYVKGCNVRTVKLPRRLTCRLNLRPVQRQSKSTDHDIRRCRSGLERAEYGEPAVRGSTSGGNEVAASWRRRVNLRGAYRQQCFMYSCFTSQARLD